MVHLKGLEPPRQRHQILSLARLPVSPQVRIYLPIKYIITVGVCQSQTYKNKRVKTAGEKT